MTILIIISTVLVKLNALIRLNHLLRFEERKVLVNPFVMSSFKYCPVNVARAQSSNKIENLLKKALRFFLNDSRST